MCFAAVVAGADEPGWNNMLGGTLVKRIGAIGAY